MPRVGVLLLLAVGAGALTIKRHAASESSTNLKYTPTCNDGNDHIDCFDVDNCAKDAPKTGKYAFVVTNTLEKNHELDIKSMESKWLEATRLKADLVLITPQIGVEYAGKVPLTQEKRDYLKEAGVKHIEVPWVIPPKMKFTKQNWCGPQDLLKLHAFNLTDYDAVIFFDNDVQVQGSMMPAFRCASKGYFLSTSGTQSPLNIGFFAVKPSSELLQTVVNFAQDSDYDKETGWNKAGFAPSVGNHVAGSECGQGFLHTLMYKNTVQGWWSFLNSGAKIKSKMVERCVWNYQTSHGCPPNDREFSCKNIRAIHKEGGGKDDWQCHKKKGFDELMMYRAEQQPSHNLALYKSTQAWGKETYGFYMHVFGTPKAVIEQLKALRTHFPNNPVYMSSDGGQDFSKACEKYNCEFKLNHAANDRWNPLPFFQRFTEATKFLNTKYVIYLEPDITITRKIIHEPTADAGGLRDSYNPGLHQETIDYLNEQGRKASGNQKFGVTWGHFALGGAGYIKSEVALKVFSNAEKYDWKQFMKLEGHRTPSSDVAMALAIGASGFTVEPWLEVMEPMKEDQPTDCAFVHHGRQEPGGKPFYSAKLEDDEQDLVSAGYSQKVEERANCQGCIWDKNPQGTKSVGTQMWDDTAEERTKLAEERKKKKEEASKNKKK